ncbi:late embryogenesis abundant protein D-34-like isoform X1 [Apium graveolens]|uniref:late embryogenesis abundant protein D-34-like isoform X1 n=1 Tax=Apium graveolens TaxID=4045 RepID=UPI003D7B1D08
MSREQSTRGEEQEQPIKYGDVFEVSDELGSLPIKPKDAAAMQAAESLALGGTAKGGPAAVMQSAADINEQHGVVGHDDVSSVAKNEGVTVSIGQRDGRRIITESVGGEVVGQYVQPENCKKAAGGEAITIGEALESAAMSAGFKTVDQSDAAAIQAAESRASGGAIKPGGVAAAAQSAADLNARTMNLEDKARLGDVLSDATAKIKHDKIVTKEDAEGIAGAELRNNPAMATHPGGVSDSMAAAAKLNRDT